jgi:sulfur oxidation c-type cytochrome SoxX
LQRLRGPSASGAHVGEDSARESRDGSLSGGRQARRRLEERREDRAKRAGIPVFGRSGESQIAPQELSYGTIGPSLYRFGKLRGFTDETRRYAWAKIYNADAFAACSNMPRFGHHHILTEQQIRDVVALLVDPASPVNQ